MKRNIKRKKSKITINKTVKKIIFIALAILMELVLAILMIRGITSNSLEVTETVFVIIIMLLLIPVMLIALLTVVLYGKKEPKIIVPAGGLSTGGKSGGSSNEEIGDGKERFCMLSKIEEQKNSYGHVKYNKNISLEKICEDFRNYAASRLKLYYDIDDIRRFIAGMAVSKILILQGMSGTGKTSMAHAFGSFMDNTSTVIPVQPMWKERTDLLGYYNEFTKRFNETILLEKMYEANYSKDIYITVLDEMNIARVEYYFAEFLSLLELPNPDERYIEVVSDEWESDPSQLRDGRIKLPENMWFIGTANNDDSTFAISDKVYDRAMIMNLDKKSDRFAAPMTDKMYISAEQFADLVEEAKSEYEVSRRNRSRLEQLDAFLIERFHITFGNRIMKQILTYIPVYISCGGDELMALDDIISKKVIRKLETQNPIYLRNTSEELIVFLDELFGAENMTLCKEYIRRLQRNA